MDPQLTSLAHSLTWTIIHSLWQGALIFALLLLYFWLFKKSKASEKFLVSFIGMLTLFISTCITFYYKFAATTEAYGDNMIGLIQNFSIIIEVDKSKSITDFINNNTNQITSIWLIGTALFMMRYFISYFFI